MIAGLIIGGVFAFIFMTAMSSVQTAFEPSLTASQFQSGSLYMAYYYANLFITNIWTYIIAFIVLILGYWIYIYNQRKSAGF